MPSFSRHSGSTTARDDNRDGRVDGHEERLVADSQPVRVGEQTDDRTVYRSRAASDPAATGPGATPPMPRSTATDTPTERIDTRRDTLTEKVGPVRDDTTDADHDRDTPPVVAGPRPRASLLATLSLIAGVTAALLVLSGPLAGYGIALGVLALLLAVGGISATGRRHVAGKTDALIGLVLALGAIVVGILALTGSLSWLGTDAEPVSRLRDWLDAQFVDRF